MVLIDRITGLGPPPARQLELVEEKRSELARRVDIYRPPGEARYLAVELHQPLANLLVQLLQVFAIDRNANPFHLFQDRDQRHLDISEEPLLVVLDQARPIVVDQLEGRLDVTAGILRDLIEWHDAH